ncbi:MAG: lipopolysaccharide heptosyltransferase II [Verrucomicrobiota bacterium]|nr:lipopolysaccharide heptosyltransferase II [Verrucomicrobiota bacterium]
MAENILIVGTNWLGDSIMSMPAIQMLKRQAPEIRLALLARPDLAPLWRLHQSVDSVLACPPGARDTLTAAWRIRNARFDRAVVFPNSFRSALIPFLAGVPVRIGAPGHWRSWLLTRTVPAQPSEGQRHQAWEYVAILGLSGASDSLPAPQIAVGESDARRAAELVNGERDAQRIGLLPGAARGPSKQWPAEHFIGAGRWLAAETGRRILVFGTRQEARLCERIAAEIGRSAISLAGDLSLEGLAAALKLCRIVIGNDSGGIHLAAAVGVKVVAIFGLTDPDRTGPLGAGHRIVTAGGVTHCRDISRDSAQARERLRGIAPERVCRAARELLDDGGD